MIGSGTARPVAAMRQRVHHLPVLARGDRRQAAPIQVAAERLAGAKSRSVSRSTGSRVSASIGTIRGGTDDGVDVLGQRRAADVAALRLGHLRGDVGEHHRVPVPVQVFVGEIARILLAHVLQPGLQRGIGLEEQRAGRLAAGRSGRGCSPAARSVRAGCASASMRISARSGTIAGPAGGDVVAEIGQSARLQPLPDDVQHQPPVVRRNPAQHAVQTR